MASKAIFCFNVFFIRFWAEGRTGRGARSGGTRHWSAAVGVAVAARSGNTGGSGCFGSLLDSRGRRSGGWRVSSYSAETFINFATFFA